MRGTILITALCLLSIICFGQDPGPTGSAFSNACLTTGDVSWTNPGTTNTILIFAKAGSAVTVGTPTSNISTYTSSATFGSGSPYQNDASAFCVYKGTGTSVSLTSLTASTTYHFIIFNATGTTYSTAATFSGPTLTTPANVTGLSAAAGTNDATVSWTDPASCFDEVMIVAKQGSSVTGTPSGNGSAYTANSLSFTDGANTSFGGGKVVSKGSSSPQTVTNLTAGQTYFFKIFTRKGTTWSAGVETSVTICTADNASALKISDTNTTATLYWTDPTCFDEIMVVTSQGSPVSGTPSGNGSSYTANSLSFTDGANTSFGGGVVVFKGGATQSPKTITNLTVGNIYYFKIFTRKGTSWSSGVSISTATGNPLILSVDPTDGSTGVPSNQVFTITFNENIFIGTGGAGAATQVTFNQSGTDPVIPRGSTSGSPSGDGYITRNKNIVTLTLSGGLDLNEVNNILIGANVFRDSSSNNFTGTVSGDWNFTVSAGVSLNNPSVGACVNQYTTLPAIDIVETSTNNVVGTDNGSYTLILGLDQSGFIFKPGTTGVTATADPGGDILSITVNSITFTQATFTIQFRNVSNDTQANDDHDEITISGLKVSMDGSSPPPANVQVKAASTITIQGITEDTTPLANITAGSTPSAPTISWPSGDNSYCSGTDLTTITVTASGGTSYNWYNDASLTSVLFTNNTTRTAAQLFGASPGTGTFTKYATSVNGCESTATPVILQITALPTAEAGGVQTVCPNDEITIGGAPTANGGAGSYTYAWTSTPAGFSSTASNPTFNAPTNATASDAITNYAVTVKDGNLCSATDNVNITVKTISENVIITQPNTYTYTTSNQPINLLGSPAGGTFSGVGVVQLNGSYKFDPQSAGIGTWPVTYTATLANGCVKSFTQNFDVTTPYDIFAALQTQYCNNESPVALSINPTAVAQIQNFINTWNTVYVPLYGYSLLKPTFTGIIRNEYETYYGDNNSVQKSGGTYVSGGVTLDQYSFYPTAFVTDQAYPAAGGTSGACATCTYGYVAVFLEFVSPLLTSPYNVPLNTDRGYVYNVGGVAAIEYGGEFPTINPVPVASFSGLLPSYCNINTNYDLTGNKAGGSFEISNSFASGYGDIVGDGIKDASEGIAPGIGEFNPQAAFGGAVTSTTKYIRYSVDPGTTGSTSQGCIGRQVNSTTIYPSTAITWDASVAASNTQFCYEGAAIDLKTSQGSPPPSGSVAFSGFGVADSGNGLAKFTPQTAFDAKDPLSTVSQTITVTAIYTNTQGCAYPLNRDFVVRVKPTSSFTVTDPTIPGTPTDFNFCYNDSPVNLQGNQPASSTLKYTIDYLTLGYTKTINNDHFTFSPQIYYNDAVAKGGSNVSDANFNVQYIVSDAIGCTASFTKLFAVSPIATITISGINDGDKFCSNEKVFPISFAPINGALDINGVLISSNQSTSINSTDLPIGNSISISYTYKSGVSQCVSNTTYTVSQIKAPKADFTTSPVCNEQPAIFAATPDPANYSWTWVLGDSIRSGTDKQTINQVFPGLSIGATQTSYIIRLIVENNPAALLVCRDSAEHTQVIGAYPKVSFDNVNVCENDFTRFSITNNIPITTAEWDFGDTYTLPIKAINTTIVAPDTHGGRTTNKYGNPYHQFVFTPGQPNEYLVQLTARTDDNLGACADTAIKRVAILEKIAPTPINPYTMSNLNGGDGLWLTEDIADSSTWVFDTPVGKFDNTNGKVWITNASGIYKAKDNSYVNSPCFDLSAFNKPVLQLKYWNKTDLAKDGAVMQYSINGGANWSTLGSQLSGLNWYSSTTISSAPGNFSQYGWTGQQQDSWLIGKNSLNEIPGAHNNVRFRIAFASDEREEYEGFAFNNVIIEERNRITLVEHFTNTGAPGSAASINNFLTDPAMNTPEVVRLEYHTNSPDQDAINAQNQSDNNARAAYYGISTNTVPIGFIDGARNGVLDFQTNWFKAALAKRSLNSSPFEIDISTIPSAKPNQITVVAQVTKIGLLGVVNPKPIMHVVIIEKSVGTDGFIMRKFLPNTSGTALVTTPSIPTITKDTLMWNVENVADLTQLAVVVFVQDEISGDVYQSSILENPTDLPTVITGTEPSFSDQIKVYPSPANKSVMLQLPGAVIENTPVKMFDVSGHEVHNSALKPGEIKKTINTQDFAAGVYLIQIETAGEIVRKKLVVMHEYD